MVETGEITKDLLDEEDAHHKSEDIEKTTDDLTSVSKIKQLLKNPLDQVQKRQRQSYLTLSFQFYNNRNLVGEAENEKKKEHALNHMKLLQRRARGLDQ